MSEPLPPAATPPTGPRVLLGVFIVGQLIFLFGNNALEILGWARDELTADSETARVLDRVTPGWPGKKGHLHDAGDLASNLLERWAQVTGQTQGWSLFAPDVRRHCVFPAVLLRWDEEPRSAPALARPLAALAAGNGLEEIGRASCRERG